MEVHGIDYYETHAKDVKLQEITSSQKNADLLASLRDNDPELKYISIVTEFNDHCDFVVREGDHLGWLGYFVGRNEKIETLYIDTDIDPVENINLNDFLRGVGRNRSITELHITIDLGESFQSLIPFLRNNDSLHHLSFKYFDVNLQCARNIALLLSQQSSLKCLSFDEEIGLDDEELAQIAAALRSQPQIEELRICYNVGRNGYVALGNALESCLRLRMLDLEAFDYYNDDERLIDVEGLRALVAGLKYCHSLTSLKLGGNLMVTEEGLRSLSTLFQSDNCRLEHLHLNGMLIDDDGVAMLAAELASLSSLKRLELRGMSIGDRGLQYLVGGLVNCNLDELDLSRNMLMDSISGMRSLGALVQRTANMHWLNLIESSLTDEGLQSFVEGMANFCNMTKLYLSFNDSITANGLASLSSLFRAEHCALSNLHLYGIHIGDDEAAVLANGLVGNKSLTNLNFEDENITARGWAAFSRLLCDTSSVNNTYLSNHTLVEIGEYGTPLDKEEVLKWNKNSRNQAAICKILDSHPDIDVTPMFEFNLMCLPLVVAWFEKAKPYVDKVNVSTDVFKNRQLSAVYKFIRGMPQLAANGYRSQKEKDIQLQLGLKSKKRKHDQTLDG